MNNAHVTALKNAVFGVKVFAIHFQGPLPLELQQIKAEKEALEAEKKETEKKEKEAKQLYTQCTPQGLEIRKYRRLKAMPSETSNKLLRIQKTNVSSNVMVLPYAVETHKYDFCLFYAAKTTS